MIHPRAERTLSELRAWIERTGWAGHDPFDVRSHRLYLSLADRASKGSALGKAAQGVVYHLEQRFPRLARRVLPTPIGINAKGMGLFARAYGLLERLGDAAAGAQKARRLDWLRRHVSEGHAGVSWGYPFDWRSPQAFIPRGTPSAVVTATVADAFRLEYARSGSADAELLRGVATFLEQGLARSVETPSTVCFSYTPIDRVRVHNANLIAGEYLLWAGHAFDRNEWRELGRRAFAYALAHQEPSGAWDYWGPPTGSSRHVDPYHTGFMLRMLRRAHAVTGDERYLESATRGYEFLVSSLLDGVVPIAKEGKPYPVNGHAVAEVLLTSRAFRDVDSNADARAAELLEWTLAHMRSDEGYFYYLWWPKWINRLPMMRWVEAWMFLALTSMVSDETTGGLS